MTQELEAKEHERARFFELADRLTRSTDPKEQKRLIRRIEQDGWYVVATKGSHRQYKHPVKPGRVTVAGHPADELAPGTLKSILRQAELENS